MKLSGLCTVVATLSILWSQRLSGLDTFGSLQIAACSAQLETTLIANHALFATILEKEWPSIAQASCLQEPQASQAAHGV